MKKVLNVIWAVLVPSTASIIFAALAFAIENAHSTKPPVLPLSVFDVSVGCAFMIAGVIVTTTSLEAARIYLLIFIVLLFLMLLNLLMPTLYHDPLVKYYSFIIVNGLSFCAATFVAYRS